MTDQEEAKIERIRALTNELDQSVHALKRILAEDKEQADKESEGNPESLFDEL